MITSTSDPQELVDETAAAAAIGVSLSCLRAHRLRGDGPPATRIGARSIVYRLADVLAWHEARRARKQDAA